MGNGHFKVISKKNLDELNAGDELSESDFATLTPGGNFVQMEYILEDDSEVDKYDVYPGIYTIKKTMTGFFLEKTQFVKDAILDEFISTKEIENKVDLFFSRFQIYYELGFEVPKRAALLYGPPGTGKSAALNKVCDKYNKDDKTIIVIWNTDKFEAHEVKDFIKGFNYNNIDKMILVAEDIGGLEHENASIRSESSLLSLLDNQEKTFTLPVFILATTNYPENFMANLTNRPNRFDDKIKVGFPEADAREALLKFFDKKEIVTDEAIQIIRNKSCDKFTPAHIRESIIRSLIYDKDVHVTLKEMVEEIKDYENKFSGPRKNVGF